MKTLAPGLSLACLMLLTACVQPPSFQATGPGSEAPTQLPAPPPAPVSNAFDSSEAGLQEEVGGFDAAASEAAATALVDQHQLSLKVDVVFAIDTSASMGEEIAATQANLGKLTGALSSGRLDARIHLMLDRTLILPPEVDPKRIAFIAQEVGSENAISRLNQLFSGSLNGLYRDAAGQPLGAPLAFRSDAHLELIVISDDDGQGEGNLAANLDPGIQSKATFNAIVGLPSTVEGGSCDISGVGVEYLKLAKNSQGSELDICSPDWTGLIARLSTDIIKRSVSFILSQPALNKDSIKVSLDGTLLSPEDWTYEPEQQRVSLSKIDLVKDGSTVKISYQTQKTN